MLLAAGWVWARGVISNFQQRENFLMLGSLPLGAHYEFWGVTVPGTVTGSAILLVALSSLFFLWLRRGTFSLLALSAYFFALFVAWVFVFARFGFEAFE